MTSCVTVLDGDHVCSSLAYGKSSGRIVARPEIFQYWSSRSLDRRRHRDRDDRHAASPTSTAAASWSSPTGPGFPGWRDVTREQWESAQWQRVNCVKNIKQLRAVLGDLVDERFYADLAADQAAPRHHVDAGAAADDQHDGARPAPPTPRRSTPTRSAAT